MQTMLTHRCVFFFFNDTATTEIYTLSLHDALPISAQTPHLGAAADRERLPAKHRAVERLGSLRVACVQPVDRKSTRLNSSHSQISYAVFCLKKKKQHNTIPLIQTLPQPLSASSLMN